MTTARQMGFLYDSDALIQIFLAGQQNIFRFLAEDYGVRSFMMNEVDTEIRSNRKHSGLIKPALDKSIKTKHLKMLSSADLEEYFAEVGNSVTLGDIRKLGEEYNIFVQTGESYTHAAGILLGAPVVSNDLNAIQVLEQNGKALPPTILSSFDLFTFAHAEKHISDADGNQLRKTLLAHIESVPKCFRNNSFVEGLPQFNGKLRTSMAANAAGTKWSDPLYLCRAEDQ